MIKKSVLLFSFLFLASALCQAQVWKAPDQEKAKERAREVVPFVKDYKDDCKILRRVCLLDEGISIKDVTETYYLLNSPIIGKHEDHYGPVRFTHGKHAAASKDCSVCHHFRPKDPAMPETTRCSACHQDAFNPEHPERIGLKAAFHQQCMTCHQTKQKGPVTCIGCHQKNVPDHKDLVKLPDNPSPFQVTAECLRCHDQAGEEMLKTAHWLWKGPSPYTVSHRKDIMHGKGSTALNNY
jgi:hypothetical protein